MQFKILKSSLLLSLMLTMVPAICSAADVQRNIILKNKIELDPKQSVTLFVYDLDLKRKAPKESDYYRHIVLNAKNAVMTLNEQQIALQKALDLGLVRIAGVSVSFNTLVSNIEKNITSDDLSYDERHKLEKFLNLWKESDINNRLVFESVFLKSVKLPGAVNELALTNYTDYKMTIHVKAPIIVSTELEPGDEFAFISQINFDEVPAEERLSYQKRIYRYRLKNR
ncbi:MAG: hypothetical protein PVJ19_16015 [Desulfobacteraceae bacterium]|jgi:hypothetical protein